MAANPNRYVPAELQLQDLADLTICKGCGALVKQSRCETHDEWHDNIKELAALLDRLLRTEERRNVIIPLFPSEMKT